VGFSRVTVSCLGRFDFTTQTGTCQLPDFDKVPAPGHGGLVRTNNNSLYRLRSACSARLILISKLAARSFPNRTAKTWRCSWLAFGSSCRSSAPTFSRRLLKPLRTLSPVACSSAHGSRGAWPAHREWLRRIPRFHRRPGTAPICRDLSLRRGPAQSTH